MKNLRKREKRMHHMINLNKKNMRMFIYPEPYYSVMYVENSKVFMNSDYFCWDNQIINNGKDFTTKDKEVNELVESAGQ